MERVRRRLGAMVLAASAGCWGTALAQGPEQPPASAQNEAAAETLSIPRGSFILGSVRITRPVLADGQRLGRGSYRLRMTGETAEQKVVGQNEALERWVEFLQAGQVKGRAMATVVPKGVIASVADRRPPRPGHLLVDVLEEDRYYRIWMNRQGDHILLHLPLAESSR